MDVIFNCCFWADSPVKGVELSVLAADAEGFDTMISLLSLLTAPQFQTYLRIPLEFQIRIIDAMRPRPAGKDSLSGELSPKLLLRLRPYPACMGGWVEFGHRFPELGTAKGNLLWAEPKNLGESIRPQSWVGM